MSPFPAPAPALPPTAPAGPVWAGILAAGIGCAVLGALVDLAEAFPRVSHALNFYNPTGDLSGKTAVTIACWLLAWAILHVRWKHRDPRSPGKILILTLALIAISLIAVFPPFFGFFAAG